MVMFTQEKMNKMIKCLKEYAKTKGYKVVYRDKTTNVGDFTFFVYKASGGHYLVGYDGNWNGEDWYKCYLATVNYIDNII